MVIGKRKKRPQHVRIQDGPALSRDLSQEHLIELESPSHGIIQGRLAPDKKGRHKR